MYRFVGWGANILHNIGGTPFLGHTKKVKMVGRALSWAGVVRFGCKVDQLMRNGEIYNLEYGIGGVAGDLEGQNEKN